MFKCQVKRVMSLVEQQYGLKLEQTLQQNINSLKENMEYCDLPLLLKHYHNCLFQCLFCSSQLLYIK